MSKISRFLFIFEFYSFIDSQMIAQAPQIEKYDNIIPLLVKFQMNGTLQKIEDEYLYWDRIKNKAKDCQPLELWSAIKLD